MVRFGNADVSERLTGSADAREMHRLERQRPVSPSVWHLARAPDTRGASSDDRHCRDSSLAKAIQKHCTIAKAHRTVQ